MVIAELRGLATVAAETSSWPYRHDLDLTGFIDGTENPSLTDAPASDALTDFTRPLSGAHYFVPSNESLRTVSGLAP